MSPDFQKASAEKAVKSGQETLRMAGAPQESEHKPPPPEPPSLAGCWLTARFESRGASLHRDFVQADVLDRRPDDRQATGLCREHVNLISALPHIDFPSFQWHWWSECVGACSEERHKRSRGALHPQPSCAPPRDSACYTWL